MAPEVRAGRPRVYCSVVCRRRAELPHRRLLRQVQAARALVVERDAMAAKAANYTDAGMREWHRLRAQRAREHLEQLENRLSPAA